MLQNTHFSFLVFANAPKARLSVLADELAATLQSLYAQPLQHWDVKIVACHQHRKAFLNHLKLTTSQLKKIVWSIVDSETNYYPHATSLIAGLKGKWIGFLYAGDVVREDFLYWLTRALVQEQLPAGIRKPGVIRFGSTADVRLPALPGVPTWSADLQWESNYLDNQFVVRHSFLKRIFKTLPPSKLTVSNASNLVVDLANRLVVTVQQYSLNPHYSAKAEYVQSIEYPLINRSTHSVVRQRLLQSRQSIQARSQDLKHILAMLGASVSLTQRRRSGWFTINWPKPDPWPAVQIVILTRDRHELLKRCIDSLLKHTRYSNLTVTVVDNGSEDIEALDYLSELSKQKKHHRSLKIKVVRDARPFNFSALNNEAFKDTREGVLVFLNNDIEILDKHWLPNMVRQAIRPDVGAVGAKLVYPDGTIQHLGVQIGIDNIASHVYRTLDPQHWTTHDPLLSCTSNPIAVTAAALAIEAEKFHQVGGLNATDLAVAYNDVDLCLRLASKGYRNVCLPDVAMIHLESATRASGSSRKVDKQQILQRERHESNWMRQHWSSRLASSSGNHFT